MNKNDFIICAILGLALPTVGDSRLAAQQAQPNGTPAHMVITAEPHKGNEAPQLTRQDVMVFEGKDRDSVTDLIPAQGDHAGLELFILLDDGSNASLGPQLNDLKKFINAQPPTTKVGVAYMQNGIAKIEQNLTPDHAQAAKALRLPMGIRGANASPYFAVSDLIKRWPQSSERREIFMATDGIDRYYGVGDLLDPYLRSAIDDAQRAGVLVSAIYTPGVGHFSHSYWNSYWGQMYLAQLAEETGGEAYYIGFNGPPVAFTPYLDQFGRRLTHQYLVAFLAKPVNKAELRSVRLRTELKNVDLVGAHQVYVTPAAEQ